jgi:hypothetical protein
MSADKILITRIQTWTLEPQEGETEEELKDFIRERYQHADTDDIQIERLTEEHTV